MESRSTFYELWKVARPARKRQNKTFPNCVLLCLGKSPSGLDLASKECQDKYISIYHYMYIYKYVSKL